MALPRIALPSARVVPHRPAVLLPVTSLALAGLLGAGVLVADAVDAPPTSPPTSPAAAEASPDPTPDGSGAGVGDEEAVDAGATGHGGTTTSGGDDNVAVAVNTRDGSTVYAVRLKVVITGADVVDSGNAAVAAASCSDCQTVAIALEGVLATGAAEVVAPQNVALAINSGCSNCQTLAYAYQDLQTVDGRVRLSGAGRRGIALLRKQLAGLRTSGLDVLAVRAEVDRIAGEFARVLEDEVVPIAPTARTGVTPTAEPVAAQADPTTSAGPTVGAPSPPAPSPSPSSTPSAADEAPSSTSPTPAATATPSGD